MLSSMWQIGYCVAPFIVQTKIELLVKCKLLGWCLSLQATFKLTSQKCKILWDSGVGEKDNHGQRKKKRTVFDAFDRLNGYTKNW